MNEDEIDVAETIHVDEFDIGTSIWIMTDGSLRLRLPHMPPSWSANVGAFESFTEHLSAALGVKVQGLDKEFFGIPAPAPDTLSRLRSYLLSLRPPRP